MPRINRIFSWPPLGFLLFIFNVHLRICLVIWERKEGWGWLVREKVGGREKEEHWSVASLVCCYWGSNAQPRCAPWLGWSPQPFRARYDAPARGAAQSRRPARVFKKSKSISFLFVVNDINSLQILFNGGKGIAFKLMKGTVITWPARCPLYSHRYFSGYLLWNLPVPFTLRSRCQDVSCLL